MKLFKNINLEKLKWGLSKTRNSIVNSISEVVSRKAVIDETVLEEIEEVLISADLGAETSETVIENIRIKLKDTKDRSPDSIKNIVKNELISILTLSDNQEENKSQIATTPFVILIVGVNGVGKTTTIGKLAHYYKSAGNKVIVGSADTFRAAATEQLDILAKRAGVEIVQKQSGTDPSAVAFEIVKKAIEINADVVLIDTAGRLQSKLNLMNELNKIKRAIEKILPGAPQETFLILDGTVGQNAISQAEEFSKVLNLTGFIITKLDGTAKGGSVIQICNNYKIPIKFIGIGEAIDDLQNFNPKSFVEVLFE